MSTEIIDLARDLIQRPSISPQDLGCQKLIAERLQRVGFQIEWLPFNETLNLWATHGSAGDKETEPCIVFAGHTDIVPVGDENQWLYPPYAAHIEENMLYGRGAADMKGSLAAMVVAAEHFVKQYPHHCGKIGLLITSDEEAIAKDGTVKVVETLMARNEIIHYCIVGEPSSNKQLGDVVKNGRRGSITADLYIEGVQGHVAYPHLAENPVHKSLAMLQELVNYQWDQGNEFFPPTSLQIANIQAGTGSNNVIPGELYVQFNLRYSTEVNAQQIKDTVKNLLKKYRLTYRICWNLSGKPFLTPKGKLITATEQAIQRILGITPTLETSGGTSDGRFIALMGAEVVEFGPLNTTIHKVNECVSCHDLTQCGEIYYRVLAELLRT